VSWQALEPITLPGWRDRPGMDAQLVWAEASGYRDFAAPAAGDSPSFIVEIEAGATVSSLIGELAAAPGRGEVTPLYHGKHTRFCTATLSRDYVAGVLSGALGKMLRRFELQVPLQAGRRLPAEAATINVAYTPEPSTSDVLLGIIDSGCPFARASLLDSKQWTRVLGLWDQNRTVAATTPGSPYGTAWSKTDVDSVLEAFRSDGACDEASCYDALGLRQMRSRESHGAFVADLFAGALSLGRRFSRDPDRVAPWTPSDDLASRSDIVFVQLPQTAVQDSTSAALPALILDGLRYVLLHVGPQTQRIVVNISEGSSRGTHDGRSILDLALTALAEEAQQTQRCPLHIVVPAGNTYSDARHAVLDTLPPDEPRDIFLLLPPGSEFPAQVSLRLPPGVEDLEVALTPPGWDAELSTKWGDACGWHEGTRLDEQAQLGWGTVLPRALPGAASEGLLIFAPTLRLDDLAAGATTAPAGLWRIRFRSTTGLAQAIHLYICRTQPNPGALIRARQARFIDADGSYDGQQFLRAAPEDPAVPASPIRRSGTLSGLASLPAGGAVVCIGGTQGRSGAPLPISAAGPAAEGRAGPDMSAIVDASDAVKGITGAGVGSGERVRMRGTSFGAPQVARALANTGALPTRLFGPEITSRTGTGTMEPE
jgi:hypothetical protein